MICANCTGEIFIAGFDLTDWNKADIIWSHVDEGCDDPIPIHLQLEPLINGAGLEGANEDECIEDTYSRLIIESPFFKQLDPDEQEGFLLYLAQGCIQWVMERKDY